MGVAGHPGPGLLEYLARVPDPRDPRGIRHSLCSLLAAAIAAVLAGSRSFTAIGEWVAGRAAVSSLPWLGIRRDPLTRQFQPPDEATIRRVLEAVDAEALDKAAGVWPTARLERHPGAGEGTVLCGGSALAGDGKSVRGTRRASPGGQAIDSMAVLDHQACAVLGQAGRGRQDQRDQPVPPIAGRTRPHRVRGHRGNAMHTQRDHAEFLVQDKNAHYILIVKKNQPGLHAQLKKPALAADPGPGPAAQPGPRPRGEAARSKPSPSPPD